MGLLMSMQVPFVGFQPIRTSEHMAAAGLLLVKDVEADSDSLKSKPKLQASRWKETQLYSPTTVF